MHKMYKEMNEIKYRKVQEQREKVIEIQRTSCLKYLG